MITYTVESTRIPLMLRQMEKSMVPHPNELIRDWSEHKPDNRIFNDARRRDWLLGALFIAAFWAFVIWYSCR